MADVEIPTKVIVSQLAGAIKLVVQVARLQDGSRKIVSISEVLGVEHDRVVTQDIFHFERIGVNQEGKVMGRFKFAGVKPKIMERLRISGIKLPEGIFDEVLEVNM